jgi:hypothetical protein
MKFERRSGSSIFRRYYYCIHQFYGCFQLQRLFQALLQSFQHDLGAVAQQMALHKI